MTRQQRFNEAYEWLRSHGYFKTQKEAAKTMNTTPPNFSGALKGNEALLTDSFLQRFNAAFNLIFNTQWLLTGEGEMLRGSGGSVTLNNSRAVVGGNVQGNGNAITDSGGLGGMIELQKGYQRMLLNSQEQIDRLLAIIERMQGINGNPSVDSQKQSMDFQKPSMDPTDPSGDKSSEGGRHGNG